MFISGCGYKQGPGSRPTYTNININECKQALFISRPAHATGRPPAQEQDEDEGEGEEWELDSPENDKARIEDSFLPREQAALSDKAPGKSMKYHGRAGTKTAVRFVKKHVKKPKFD